jgi:hypothetical protein
MADNKYHPLTEEQYLELKNFLNGIGNYLPTDRVGYIWGTYNTVREINEPQPCTCASAGGMWKRAIDELNAWVKDRE